MKRLFYIICVVISVFALSSCTKVEEEDYNIVGYWKFTGFNGKDYPDNYHFMEITANKIVVYDRHENLVDTFSYTRKKNTLTLSAPFAGEYTSILVDTASYNPEAKLGQMSWDCGNGQAYYFSIWDR